ncbi:MAG: nodulation protein NfeD [candidate division KSB1 bacterium]|nr:nodulation protein NfeD [candidate division KSB1 bacterium]
MGVRVLSLCLIVGGLWLGLATMTTGADTVIDVHRVEGVINPVIVEYMAASIRRAEEARAVAVIFQLDTPGGLVDSTREIVKALLNATVPTVVYVSPSGARAASAGTFITLAGHVAAMAPGTNIGAAHPVSGEGKDIEGDMRQKAENDLAAFARSIAEKRRRNAEWAEKAVRDSVAVTESEALEQHVIDLIADDVPDLVKQLDGRQISLHGNAVTLHTAGATVRYRQMHWRQRLLAALSHPQIALMLLSLGSIGLLVELYNPGLIFPGVVGALALLLALYSLQTLPINYTGLLLIGLGMLMFILEIKVTSFGMLTLGGTVAMALGALMLVDSPEEYLRIPLASIILVVGTTAGLFLLVVGAAVRSVGRRPVSGREALLGSLATVRERIDPTGTVFVQGTLWSARSATPIEAGATVRVVGVDGLKLTVEQVKEAER